MIFYKTEDNTIHYDHLWIFNRDTKESIEIEVEHQEIIISYCDKIPIAQRFTISFEELKEILFANRLVDHEAKVKKEIENARVSDQRN